MPHSLDDDGAVWALALGMVNAYLIDDGTVTLVDTGTPGSVGDLREEMAAAGYDVADIDRVLITHFDLDHVGGLAELGVSGPVHAMDPDASILEGTARLSLLNKKGLFQRAIDFLLTRPEGGVERLSDEATVGGFTAYHTPGHTPGHATFHHPELGVALLGDLVRGVDGRLGTLPWPLAYDNNENRRSIRALADRDLSFDIACMGHGDPLAKGGDRALAHLAMQ